jgi:hypothetical protein
MTTDQTGPAAGTAALTPPGVCPAEWGACPDHGNTVHSSGGRSWCERPGCGRTWPYDRVGQPCTEPIGFEVRGDGDPDGLWTGLCTGHAIGARGQLVGGQIRPVTTAARP